MRKGGQKRDLRFSKQAAVTTAVYLQTPITDPNNFRAMCLLSCFGNLFTSCLNERLSNFVKIYDTARPEQAGFKFDESIFI